MNKPKRFNLNQGVLKIPIKMNKQKGLIYKEGIYGQ